MENKKERAYELWRKAGGKNAPHGTLKSIATELEISDGTMRTWKRLWVNSKNVSKNVLSNKKIKEVAKVMIEEGYSISEVSRQTETPRSTIGKWSKKESLQKSQLENLKEFAESCRSEVIENKKKRLKINKAATEKLEGLIEKVEFIPKDFMSDLMKTEELEQKILELDRIERYERVEAMKKENKVENELPGFFEEMRKRIMEEEDDED